MSQKPIPKYRRQKNPSGDRAFVELSGKRVYLGAYDSPQSRAEYHRLVAEWEAGGRRTQVPQTDVTIVEVIAAFKAHVERTYADDRTAQRFKSAWEPLSELYGETPAAEFGPLRLKAVREKMIVGKRGTRTRQYVNALVGAVKHIFKWAASEELVPASVFHGLQTVAGFRHGRTEAREAEPVKPVPQEHVGAVRPYLSKPVAALLDLLALTGARPGELVIMRPIDIDTTGKLWTYIPATHKTAWRGQKRMIHLGPRAQEVVRPFLAGRAVEAYLFSPSEAVAEQRERRHEERVTPLSCGNKPGSNVKQRPRKEPGERYTPRSLYGALQYAIARAGVPHWTVYQLRHSVATEVRKEFGIDASAAVLGHRDTRVTERYAELNQEKAATVMAKIG